MVPCPSCGEKIPEEAQFCPGCGARFSHLPPALRPAKPFQEAGFTGEDTLDTSARAALARQNALLEPTPPTAGTKEPTDPNPRVSPSVPPGRASRSAFGAPTPGPTSGTPPASDGFRAPAGLARTELAAPGADLGRPPESSGRLPVAARSAQPPPVLQGRRSQPPSSPAIPQAAVGRGSSSSGSLPAVDPSGVSFSEHPVEGMAPLDRSKTMAISEYRVSQTPGSDLAEVTLGRQPACTIVYDAPDVSGWHARILRKQSGGLVVEDLGSTNGTYVNGERVHTRAISFRDDVRLGSAVVQLSHPSISGLVVSVNRRPADGEPIVLGSASTADVWIRDPSVASRHASLKRLPDGSYLLTDLQSPQGTYVDSPNFRITEAFVHTARTILLGGFVLPMGVLLRALERQDPAGLQRSEELDEALQRALSGGKTTLLIGRDPACDLVVFHPTISGRHTRLTPQSNATVAIEDLGSTNGTYINGVPVTRGTAKPGDVVSVGAIALKIGAEGRIEAAQRARVRLDLVKLGLTVRDRSTGKPRALLDQVSFSIYPKELIGMLGPSGAGKTTLLMTVLGITRPTHGGVLLNGKPLYAQYDAFRTNVGYVPQDDIVHPELTVWETLRYACKLRLPVGTPNEVMKRSIEETLRQVGLWDQRHLQIGSAQEKVLSGGQRRRVNLAVELVTDPSLLILDEPTSGLSWTDAADVISTLRRLADGGRTIVLTIHQPDFQEYEKFDSVAILGRGGKLLFFGPPDPDSYSFFGADRGRPREMFDHVEQMPPDSWRELFQQTDTFRRFVMERGPKDDAPNQSPPPKPRRRSSWRQFPVLLGRTFKLTWRAKAALLILLLQAPVLGSLIGITIGDSAGFRAQTFGCVDSTDERYEEMCTEDSFGPVACSPEIQMQSASLSSPIPKLDARVGDPRVGLIAILMALFLPMVIASSNSLVGERTIYERERLAGLNIIPYVGSRFAVLVFLGALVAALNMGISIPMLGLQGGWMNYLAVGVMTTSAAAAIGLALSAAVKRTTSALWGINLLVIPQLLFAGGIVRLEGLTYWASWLTTTRYGLEALTHIDLHAREAIAACQVERYLHNYPGFPTELPDPLLFAAAGTGAIVLLSMVCTVVLLRVRDN